MRTLIVGASGGIGAALADSYRALGEVATLSRSADGLDITDPDSVAQVIGALEPPFHRVIVASGALSPTGAAPEKSLSALDAEALAAQFAVNAIGPALVLKEARRLMPRREDVRFAALSARVGSIGDNRLGGWHGYRAAKAALNQLIHGAAIEMARTHRGSIVALLHPGTVATSFTAAYQDRHETVPPEEAAANLTRVIEGLTPEQTGGFFDYAGKAIAW